MRRCCEPPGAQKYPFPLLTFWLALGYAVGEEHFYDLDADSRDCCAHWNKLSAEFTRCYFFLSGCTKSPGFRWFYYVEPLNEIKCSFQCTVVPKGIQNINLCQNTAEFSFSTQLLHHCYIIPQHCKRLYGKPLTPTLPSLWMIFPNNGIRKTQINLKQCR